MGTDGAAKELYLVVHSTDVEGRDRVIPLRGIPDVAIPFASEAQVVSWETTIMTTGELSESRMDIRWVPGIDETGAEVTVSVPRCNGKTVISDILGFHNQFYEREFPEIKHIILDLSNTILSNTIGFDVIMPNDVRPIDANRAEKKILLALTDFEQSVKYIDHNINHNITVGVRHATIFVTSTSQMALCRARQEIPERLHVLLDPLFSPQLRSYQIIKALECCAQNPDDKKCESNCPYGCFYNCSQCYADALEYINELNAEIDFQKNALNFFDGIQGGFSYSLEKEKNMNTNCDIQAYTMNNYVGFDGKVHSFAAAVPEIKNVDFNEKKGTTTVIWEDGTITMVKCMPGDSFSYEHGFAMAVLKKLYEKRDINPKTNEPTEKDRPNYYRKVVNKWVKIGKDRIRRRIEKAKKKEEKAS